MSRGRLVRRVGALALLGAFGPGLALAQPPEPTEPPPAAPQEPVPSTTPAPSASPTTSAPASITPAAAQTATAGADTMAAELTQAAVSEAATDDVKLSAYGFADFTFSTPVRGDFPSGYSTFSVGNLNLYLGAELGGNWRSLSEIRFMYLPHGSRPGGRLIDSAVARTDTTIGDYSDLNRTMRWGAIHIERAWVEYTAHELLTVRLGHWLTPWGIWNVDHGSPVILGVRRPYISGHGLLPESQTGIETYGSIYIDATRIGYHLTLSNGRGPLDNYMDLDHNKAIGARLFVSNESELGNATFGISGYRGKFTDRQSALGLGPQGEFILTDPVTLEYDELALALDLKFETKTLLFQGEIALQDVAYDDATRPADPALLGGPPGFVADSRKWGLYTLLGYRTPFFNITPYVGAEYYAVGNSDPEFPFPDVMGLWAGLNWRPTPRVVLKLQYTHGAFPTKPLYAAWPDWFSALEAQAAWSF